MLESFNPVNPPSMRRLVPATFVGLALLLAGQAASALGLGRVSTLSYLGNPLEFNIAVTGTPADALSPDCITADVFAGDSRVSPEMVRVRVNRSGDGTPTSLRVITGTRIDEPVASVELTLDCGTRVTRKYVVFVDPPVINMAQADAADTASPAVAAPRRASASRERVPGSSSQRTRSPRSPGGTVQAGGTGTASAAQQRRVARAEAARAARAAAAPAERGSRLKLESAPALSAGAPVKERSAAAAPGPGQGGMAAPGLPGRPPAVGAATAMASASAASAAADAASTPGGLVGELVARAEADALALNAERLKALEERMTRLLADNKSMQKSMLDLQTQLAQAEASRYANPLVYGLVAALALLLLAVIALLWRQASMRKESEWLKAAAADSTFGEGRAEPKGPAARSIVTPAPRPAVAVPAGGSAAAAAALAAGAAASASAADGPRLVGEETAPSAALRAARVSDPAEPSLAGDGAVVGEVAVAPPAPAPGAHESTSVFDTRREVSVEELIDLEQQADFFVVLGQDDAAIDLLMGHVQGTGGASPLPYLKLLEIHRRRDERDAYDKVRDRFNRRFGAFAPEWEAHTGHDRALEDYPAVVERLQTLWPEPTKAMDALSGLLFQRDLSAQTFDLPAYGELLFLYSLARERAEHEPPADGVDLLLPLDDEGPAAPAGRPAAVGIAAAVGAAGAAGAAFAAADGLPAIDEPLSLDELPASVPEVPPTYPVPLSTGTDPRAAGPLDGLIDLNISDDPEEPKGPLSKW